MEKAMDLEQFPIIKELTQGKELEKQLRNYLNPSSSHETRQFLVEKILCSYEKALSLLNRTSNLKDRRQCYKRRKSLLTWTKETSNLIDDGHQWRKYGQKEVLDAKYPRNYYRCNHRRDQGCQATKQVQRIQEDPPRYRTSYFGNHSCRNKPDNPLFPSLFIKQEYKDDLPGDMTCQSSSSDYLLSSELTTFESTGQLVPMLSCDHGDEISGVTSCSSTTHSLDMDMMVDSDVDFADFQFDF